MWEKVGFESLMSDVKNIMTMFTTTNSIEIPIDNLWTKFSKHIIDIQKRHVPSRMTSPRFSQPWITRECKRKIRRKKRAYNKFKRTKLDSDWLKYQEAAKKSRKACKNAFNTYVQLSVSPDLKSNPKKFFSFIKNKQSKNIGVSPLRESTSLKFTKQDRPCILNNQFSSVFSVDDKTSPNVQGPQGDTMHEINITKEGITRLLKNLAPSKASGTDMISAKSLKETADEVAIGLTLIFKASSHQANFPNQWRNAIVTPIFKGGNKDHSKAENCRPISLTSITSKVLENIIHRNIISHLDEQRMLTDVQHGFRKS